MFGRNLIGMGNIGFDVGVYRKGRIVMWHYDRRYAWQAIQEAKKHGVRVEFCRKVNIDKNLGNIEKLNRKPNFQQEIVRVKASPYKNAIAMDEFIGQKRNKRRANLYKEKEENA